MTSHCFTQQGLSFYLDVMTELTSVFKNVCYHYSLQYSTEASLGGNKESRVLIVMIGSELSSMTAFLEEQSGSTSRTVLMIDPGIFR